MHTVGRWGLRVPDGSDGPPNVPLWMDRLAVDLTDVAKDNQGTLAARPTSTALNPGVAGRYFTTTDEDDPAGVDRRRVYRDAGQAWDELATLPLSGRMHGAGSIPETAVAAGATGLAKGAFSAYRSAAVSLATGAAVVFDAEERDVSNAFNLTNGRYTPPAAGIYRLNWQLMFASSVTADAYLRSVLTKNGAAAKYGMPGFQRGVALQIASVGTAQVESDGDDFFGITIEHGVAGSVALQTGALGCYFQGELIGRP